MFIKEYKVNGVMVKGQLIGNWSNKSYYALKLESLKTTNLDEAELNELISELQGISQKIKESNAEYENDKKADSKS